LVQSASFCGTLACHSPASLFWPDHFRGRGFRIRRPAPHLAAGVWLETPFPEHAFEVYANLARRYGPKLGVRTLDSLHVACAPELNADRFWTFDERQAKLAKPQGLNISK
jgi:hypothetical protein